MSQIVAASLLYRSVCLAHTRKKGRAEEKDRRFLGLDRLRITVERAE